MADEKRLCAACMYDSIIEELKRDAERNSEQHREFYGKFNSQETAIAISEERYANLLSSIGRLESAINTISSSLEEIKEKPAKRWDGAVMTIISCVITAVVVFMLSQMGL